MGGGCWEGGSGRSHPVNLNELRLAAGEHVHGGVGELVRSPHEEPPKDAAMHVAALRLACESVAQAGAVHQHSAPIRQPCTPPQHISRCHNMHGPHLS